jgi:hypothetical protein
VLYSPVGISILDDGVGVDVGSGVAVVVGVVVLV